MADELVAALRGHDSRVLAQYAAAGDDPTMAAALAGLADEFSRRGGVPVRFGDLLFQSWGALPRVREVLLRDYFACGVWVYGHVRVPAMQVVLGDVVPSGAVRLGDALMKLTRCGNTFAEQELAYCIPEHYLRWWLREAYMDRLHPQDLPELLRVRARAIGWNAINAGFLSELCAARTHTDVPPDTAEIIRQALALPYLPEAHRRIVRRFLLAHGVPSPAR